MNDISDTTIRPQVGDLYIHEVSAVQFQVVDYADGNKCIDIDLFGYRNSEGSYLPKLRVRVFGNSRNRKTPPRIIGVQSNCNVIDLMEALKVEG